MTDRNVSAERLARDLDAQGWALIPGLLTQSECAQISALYAPTDVFRSHIDMARHGYGRGEYRYFSYPLPPLVAALRAELYAALAPIASRWAERLRQATGYPATHAEFLARCHAAGQTRPTPLLLRYGPGDYNRLHQDLYGEHAFPLQVAILLGAEFTGGEFIFTEQSPRMQSRAEVVPLAPGDAVVFAGAARPVPAARGDTRASHRHGVATLRSGTRTTLGIIFHDAV